MSRYRCVAVLWSSLGAAACDGILGGGDVVVTLDITSRQLPADGPVGIAVTAVNTGDQRIVWGHGSSSCQLGAVIRVAGADRRIDVRGCTTDLVPQGLDPGESRTESWPWELQYLTDSGVQPVAPGEYELYGLAGSAGRSEAVEVTVVDVP